MASPNPKPRAMIDANVLVAGTGWPRWAYEILQHALAEDFQLVLSTYVIEEAHFHIQRIAPTALPRFEAFRALRKYEEFASPIDEAAYEHRSRDPKDIAVAGAAIQTGVDCLVSNDKDLTESEALKAQVNVVLPAVFLRDYMGWSSERLEAIRHRNWSDLS